MRQRWVFLLRRFPFVQRLYLLSVRTFLIVIVLSALDITTSMGIILLLSIVSIIYNIDIFISSQNIFYGLYISIMYCKTSHMLSLLWVVFYLKPNIHQFLNKIHQTY